MLNEMQIKNLEGKLNEVAADYYDARNREFKERCRGYSQGIAFALAQIGYAVEWEDGKATVVNEG